MSFSGKKRSLNILLVEDDEVDVMNVQRALNKSKLPSFLCVAGNGLEALEVLRQRRYHDSATDVSKPLPSDRLLILLDLNMPRMGGIEFLQTLRSDPQLRALPVIVLTTSNEERDLVEAYRCNVAGYILKPVTFANFLDVVTTLNNYWTLCEMP